MEGKIHFTRAPKYRELEAFLKRGERTFFITKSAKQRLSEKAEKLLKENKAQLILESARGRPIGLDMMKIAEVIELNKDHRTFREIENLTGISKSTCHYLIKYAERQKLKSGGKIIYL